MARKTRSRWGIRLALGGAIVAAAVGVLVLLVRAQPKLEAYFATPEGQALPVGVLSAGGRMTVTIRNDGAAEVRDANGTRIGIVRGHGARLVHAAFTPDGTAVQTIDASGILRETALDGLSARDAVSASAPQLRAWTESRLWAPFGRPAAELVKSAHLAIDPYARAEFRVPEMVLLPPGRFVMGSPDSEEGRDSNEGPQHTVEIRYTFAVGKYEVTWNEWEACVSNGGCGRHRPFDWGVGRGSRPVINVSWYDAQAYVSWLNQKTGLTGRPDRYRLLSEAEWEYAARAGSESRWSFGDDESRLGEFAWFVSNSEGAHQPVGGKTANDFGLHDMHGNLLEWVEDCWNGSYEGAPNDGSVWNSGDCSARVYRGGSWGNTSKFLRSAMRVSKSPGERTRNVGFRIARTIES